jgi:fatty-acyl-CoA synthase
MQRYRIQSLEDVQRIGQRPYAEFMAHEHVYDGLSEAAALYPQRKAISFVEVAEVQAPARSWTYAELLRLVHQAANLFSGLVHGEEPRIAMLVPNIPEAQLTLWGGETAGVVCPINFLLDAQHIAELVTAARCNILVALGPHPELDIWSKALGAAQACKDLKHVLAVGGAPGYPEFMPSVREQPGEALQFPLRRDRNQLAALFHTGGTTGAPKLAQHTHGNQLHAAWSAAQMYAMDERDVILNGFPLFHVAGAFVYGLSALLSGAEIVLPTLTGLRNTGFMQRYWDFVEKHQVSLLAAVPTVIASVLSVEPQAASLRSVRALLTGGSPLPNELASSFERRHNIPVRNILGMTECAGVVSIEPFLSPRRPGSCGLPLPFTEVIAQGPSGQRCAPGESGIVQLRGPNVGPGYTEVSRNAGTFDADGWLVTGDIGHIDEHGFVFITGRSKDVIIRSGHNIDPQLIEDALLQHPDVLVAAAVGEPDEYAGELPVVFVSLREASTATPERLSEFAKTRIPERPAYPKRVHILPSMPLTAVGKVFKPRLRALSCEAALRERLQKQGIAEVFRVEVGDTPRGLQVRFCCPSPAQRDRHRSTIEALMRPFPLDYVVWADEQESRSAP